MLKIKELREERGLTQKELAKNIDTTATNIGRWEKELNEPAYSYLIKLADFFDVSIDYLVGREDDLGIKTYVHPSAPAGSGERAALSADEKEILSLFEKLGPFERGAMLIQLRALAEEHEKEPFKR